jgi:histidinol-phosphate/aromatic aminotransferase/cobyric acid decarboxylase-like protein
MSHSRRAFITTFGAGGLAPAAQARPRRLAAAAVPAPDAAPSWTRLNSNENAHGPGPAVLAAVEPRVLAASALAMAAAPPLEEEWRVAGC